MDFHSTRIRSRVCFGKIEEVFNFCRAYIKFPERGEELVFEDTFVDEQIFLISTLDPWYGDIIIYLQTLKTPTHLSRDER